VARVLKGLEKKEERKKERKKRREEKKSLGIEISRFSFFFTKDDNNKNKRKRAGKKQTWKLVGCPIFDLSTFFTGFLRLDFGAGFPEEPFAFSCGLSDEPKPFPYFESFGSACFVTAPPMIMAV
jgi:hypothetical protein